MVLAAILGYSEGKTPSRSSLRQSNLNEGINGKASETNAVNTFELSESDKRKLDLEVYERFLKEDNNLSLPEPPPTSPECPNQCDDNDLCTNDFCDPVNGCTHTPVKCDEGKSCDPMDGQCKRTDELRPCIAVIDESSLINTYIDSTWNTFRTNWPNRTFCLLQPQIPNTGNDVLYRPPAFDSDPRTKNKTVTRDGGNPADASDWFNDCGFGSLSTSGIDFVGLFIDTSGSMALSTVQASYDLFVTTLANAGLSFCKVENSDEDWITPFDTTLGTTGGGGDCVIA